MKSLAIFGASGHGRVVADVALASGYSTITFFDDAIPNIANIGNVEILGGTNYLLDNLAKYDGVLIAIGDCNTRLDKQKLFEKAGGNLVTIIHPSSCVSSHVQIGVGVVVMAGTVINSGAIIDDGCIINTGSIVEHDCNLGEAVHLSPSAVLLGDVKVATCSWIGAGSIVLQGIEIGANAIVGAGSVVLKPVYDGQTVVGCPATPLAC